MLFRDLCERLLPRQSLRNPMKVALSFFIIIIIISDSFSFQLVSVPPQPCPPLQLFLSLHHSTLDLNVIPQATTMLECTSGRPSKIGLGLVISLALMALGYVDLFSSNGTERVRAFGATFRSSATTGPTDNLERRSLHEKILSTTSTYQGFGQGVLATERASSNEHDNGSGKKPRFVIHCGPMKTGTSSL